MVTLINALRHRGGGIGGAALCGGGGQGDASSSRSEDRRMTASSPDRNLALELVRVTEMAAIAAARYQGRGDKNAVDQAAVDAMRHMLATVDMDGIVVIGEGEKDEAPMLYNGEVVGNGSLPKVDVAVDPVDGTRLTSQGQPGALAVHRPGRARLDVRPRQPRLHGQDRRWRGGCRDDRHRGPRRPQPRPGGEGEGQGRHRI